MTDLKPKLETAEAEIARLTTITDRLRGKYVVPVNDGAGLLDGKDTFTREFKTPPIQHEAAARIEELEAEIARLHELWGVLNAVRAAAKFGNTAGILELLPRMNEVLDKVKE